MVVAMDGLAAGLVHDERLSDMTHLRQGYGGQGGPSGHQAIGPSGAFLDGLNRVKRAPVIVIGLWLSTLLLALPLTIALQQMLGAHLGTSLAAQAAAEGVNYDWWNEFLAQTSGVGATFVPAIIGFAAVLKNLSTFADARAMPTLITSAVLIHLTVSLFLIGGAIDRLARDRAVGAPAFFAACGMYFMRFLRLGIVMAVVYGTLFGPYHTWLFDRLYPSLIAEVTVERTAFAIHAGLYLAFAVPLFFFNMLFDYAKIRAVVEDRRSMLGAIAAGWRFIRRQPLSAAALYAINTVMFLAVALFYYAAAPGASANALAFAVGQLYSVLRVIVRLQFAASQTALFQGRLAHAGYVARPVPKWPDSPAAEAIGPR
jgi:hypothetical protein